MISLILPYWDRQAATDEALRYLVRSYRASGLELEVVIVDDGSPVPFDLGNYPLNVQVVRLPKKTIALCPCVPINEGVKAASGDLIALSNAEVLHKSPVLQEMRDAIKTDKDYVLAAACYEGVWHCHSSKVRSAENDAGGYLPPGADYHFMSMMRRELWDAAGGFDEDYRQGAGYDDADFVRRLHRAGANFIRRDDLVVEHVRAGAHAQWPIGAHARNRALFHSKWQPLP